MMRTGLRSKIRAPAPAPQLRPATSIRVMSARLTKATPAARSLPASSRSLPASRGFPGGDTNVAPSRRSIAALLHRPLPSICDYGRPPSSRHCSSAAGSSPQWGPGVKHTSDDPSQLQLDLIRKTKEWAEKTKYAVARADRLQKEYGEAIANMNRLEKERDDAVSSRCLDADYTSRLEKERDEALSSVENLRDALSDAESEASRLQKNLSAAYEQVNTLGGKLRKAEKERLDAIKGLERAQGLCRKAIEELAGKDDDIRALTAEIDRLSAEVSDARAKFDAAQTEKDLGATDPPGTTMNGQAVSDTVDSLCRSCESHASCSCTVAVAHSRLRR